MDPNPKTPRKSEKDTYVGEIGRTRENPPLRILTCGTDLGCFHPDHDSQRTNKKDPTTRLYEFKHAEES